MRIFEPTYELKSGWILEVLFDNDETHYPTFRTKQEALDFKKNIEKELENVNTK